MVVLSWLRCEGIAREAGAALIVVNLQGANSMLRVPEPLLGFGRDVFDHRRFQSPGSLISPSDRPYVLLRTQISPIPGLLRRTDR